MVLYSKFTMWHQQLRLLCTLWNAAPRWRRLLTIIVVMEIFWFGIALEEFVRWLRIPAVFRGRDKKVPNYNNVWNSHDIIFHESRHHSWWSMVLTNFGNDYMITGGRWEQLCNMDSNRNNVTNGAELGDPCCLWRETSSSMHYGHSAKQEYRRWLISGPTIKSINPNLLNPWSVPHEPANCSAFDASLYKEQFLDFYYHEVNAAGNPVSCDFEKLVAALVVVALLAYLLKHGLWSYWLSLRVHHKLSITSCTYFYLDFLSGLVHVVLDYAPKWLPIIGKPSYGSQLHHFATTQIFRDGFFNHVSHVHPIIVFTWSVALLIGGSRRLWLWNFWCGVFAHLFQISHRWAHTPSSQLHWMVRTAQDIGLLLNNDRHMIHHEDPTRKFCFLSGLADPLLDAGLEWVPGIRYVFWLQALMCALILPAIIDLQYSGVARNNVENTDKTSV